MNKCQIRGKVSNIQISNKSTTTFTTFTLNVKRPLINLNREQIVDKIPVIIWGEKSLQFNQSVKDGDDLVLIGTIQFNNFSDSLQIKCNEFQSAKDDYYSDQFYEE